MQCTPGHSCQVLHKFHQNVMMQVYEPQKCGQIQKETVSVQSYMYKLR